MDTSKRRTAAGPRAPRRIVRVSGQIAAEIEINHDVVVGEVAPNITLRVGEERLRLPPVVGVDSVRTM